MSSPRRRVAPSPWLSALEAQGYESLCERSGKTCAIHRFNYTTAILVGLDPIGYERRYCFEHAEEARASLAEWDAQGHPGGPWIKCKGAGIELLNPLLS